MTHAPKTSSAFFVRLIVFSSLLSTWMAGCVYSNKPIPETNPVEPIRAEIIQFEEELTEVDPGTNRYLTSDGRRFTLTDEGELWSINGLYLVHWKVDTHTYQLFKLPESSGQINAIDANGSAILLGSDQGKLIRFETDTFSILHDLGAETAIQTILSGEDERIWLGTNQGVFRLDSGSAEVFSYPLDGLSDEFIHSLYIDSQNQLWAGTVDAISTWKDDRWINFNLEKGEVISAILETENHEVLAASGSTLYRQNADGWQVQSIPSVGVIHSMALSGDGKVALIGAAGELIYLDPITGSFIQMAMPGAVRVAASQSGRLVIGSIDSGMFYSDGGTWQQIICTKQLPGANVLSLASTGNGEGWIGTENGLAFQPKLGPVEFFSETQGDSIISVAADNPGSVWFQTSSAIGRKVGDDMQIFAYGPDRANHPISDMSMSSDGTLWYLTRNGLVQMINGERQVIDTPFSRPDTNTHTLPIPIMIDSLQMVWLALPDGQINMYSNGNWDSLLLPIDDQITTIYVVSASDIWIGTTHSGLLHDKDDTWSMFDLPGKESQPMVTCIKAAAGKLLVGSADGLFKVLDPGGVNPVISTTAWNDGYIQTLAADEMYAWVGYLYGGAERIPLNKFE